MEDAEALAEALLPPSPDYQTFDTDRPTQAEAEELRAIEHDTIPETATYGRNLNWSSAYILVISRVIGSGIFATPGAILKSAGSVGLTLVLWVVGAILSACGLAVSLEYGCMLPRSGGDKVYLEFTYRHPRFLASTLIAAQAVLLGFTASNCIVFSKYIWFSLNTEPTEFQSKALAVGLLTVITFIHGRFLKAGIRIQNTLGWIKVFLVAIMAITGLFVIAFHPREETVVQPSGTRAATSLFSWDELWRDTNWSWGSMSTSLFKVFYSYAGLSNVNNVLNEVKNPVRTLKTVGPAALITACGLYLLANISYFLVVPIQEIKESGELVAALFFERAFGPHVGRTILPLAIAISAAGNVMVVTFTLVSDPCLYFRADIDQVQARVNQEVARQGFLPFAKALSSSRPYNSPLGGLLVHYIPSILVITLPPQGDVYNFILDVEGYPGQFFALAITAGLILLRYRRPDLRRPFKAWLPAVWLRIVMCLALLAAPFFPPPGWKGDVDFFYATYAIVGVGMYVASPSRMLLLRLT